MTCFFVGGFARTGTTLLQSILCSDRTTNPLIREASYLRGVIDTYNLGKNLFDEHNKDYFSSVEELRQFTAKWAREFIGQVSHRFPGVENIVLKHPQLTPNFPNLFELLEDDVRFLIIVRDPRDTIASLVRVGDRMIEQAHPEARNIGRDMARLGNLYMSHYYPALNHPDKQYQSRLTIIRYEDLVTEPASAIEKIRRGTGLKLEDFDAASDWAGTAVDFSQEDKNRNPWLSELYGKEISTSRIGRYKKILSPQEVDVLEKTCTGPLKSFGYI